jgi:serine/threonine protein kinase
MIGARFQDKLEHIRLIVENEHDEVELCSHSQTGEQFVRKLMEWNNREFAAREIGVSRAVSSHENVLELVDSDFSSVDKVVRLVYPFAAKGDLFDYLQTRPGLRRDVSWVAWTFRSIVRGVHHMHQCGVLHRDIKLENVVIEADGTTKICDFSFSEWIKNPVGLRRTSSHGIKGLKGSSESLEVDTDLALRKNVAKLVGTGGCISPETISSCKATKASDVFALGVLLYEMVTGRKAFPVLQTSEISYPSWLVQFDEGGMVDLIQGMVAPLAKRITMEDILSNEWLNYEAENYAPASSPTVEKSSLSP